MKQFNIREALANTPVVTRDGREAIVTRYSESDNEECRVSGYVNGVFRQWYEHGGYFRDIQSNLDLFIK